MCTTRRRTLILTAAVALVACGSPSVPPLQSAYDLDFGLVAVGSSRTQSLSITNHASSTVRLLSIETPSNPAFTTMPLTSVPIAAGARLEVPFTFAPGSGGATSASAVLHTDSRQQPTASVALTGTGVAGCLQVVPPSLDFGNAIFHTSVTYSLQVTNCAQVPVTITDAFTPGSRFTITGPSGWNDADLLRQGDTLNFVATYAPMPPQGGEDEATVQLVERIEGAPQLASVVVPLRGQGVYAGLFINPDLFPACPTVVAGQSSQWQFTIQNAANEPFTLFEVALMGGGAALTMAPTVVSTDSPVTLAPHTEMVFTVTFAPNSAGNYQASIAITDDHGENISLPLSCQAT